MAIQLPALAGAPRNLLASFGDGMAQGQAYRANELSMQDAEKTKRERGVMMLSRVSKEILGAGDPMAQQKSLATFKSLIGRLDPEALEMANAITLEDIPRLDAILTSQEDQLKRAKLGAEIETQQAKTGYEYARTNDIGYDNQRADWKTGADLARQGAVANAQIGNYNSQISDRNADNAFQREKMERAGWGQVPSGYAVGVDGIAAAIPGLPAPATKGPSAPSGYRYTADGNLEVIPGGPAADKRAREDRAFASGARAALDKTDAVIGKVDEALAKVDDWSAGLGSSLSWVPASGARDLQATLDTIKANLGFDQLRQMRDAASSGASGLGQVTVREIDLLQSVISSLDQGQSPEQLARNLRQIKQSYEKIRADFAGAASRAEGGGASDGVDDLLKKYGVE